MTGRRIVIRGRVQRVGFRAWTDDFTNLITILR